MSEAKLPPAASGRQWQALSEAAARHELVLPRCCSCGTYQYPLRELCRHCLQSELEWKRVSGRGTLLSWTLVHASLEPFFQARLPWPVAKVKLDAGPVLFAHLSCPQPASGMAIQLHNCVDAGGTAVLIATPPGGDPPKDERFKDLLR